MYKEDIFGSTDTVAADVGKFAIFFGRFLKILRFSTKILTIRIVEAQCIEVIKELMKIEAEEMFSKFNERMRPRSPIHNIQKYTFLFFIF